MKDKQLQFAIKLAKSAGDTLYSYFPLEETSIRTTPKEIKTVYDEVSDTLIKKEIQKNFPTHSILTEESGYLNKDNEYLWIIDPLDGTGNFVNGNPFFAVSISLWIHKMPYIGVIYAPALEEIYVSVKDEKPYYSIRKKELFTKVSNISEIKNSYIVYCEGGENDKKYPFQLLNQFYSHAKDMRKLGSAALELAWVGTGRADAYITPQISLWDIAAGVLFVHESGGKIMNFNMKEYEWSDLLYLDKINLVATNHNLILPKISY